MKFYRDVVVPMLDSGQLVKAEMQIPYELQPAFTYHDRNIRPITYVADFVLYYADGHTEVIDVKGMADTTAKLKRKLFWYVYPSILYRWISYSKIDGGWCDYETVQRNRRLRKSNKNKTVKTNGGN